LPKLKNISAPALTSVFEDILLAHLSELTSVEMPVLTNTNGALILYNNSKLGSLNFSSLRSLGLKKFGGTSQFTEVSFFEGEIPDVLEEMGRNVDPSWNKTIEKSSIVIGRNVRFNYTAQHKLLSTATSLAKNTLMNTTLPQAQFDFGKIRSVQGSVFVFGN